MGPRVKPSEKATPMTAWGEGRLSQTGRPQPRSPPAAHPPSPARTMPRLRAEGEPRSAMMAVERLTFPLLMPPITLEARKAAKLLEAAHMAYEVARPACLRVGSTGQVWSLEARRGPELGRQTQVNTPGALPCSGASKVHLCSQWPLQVAGAALGKPAWATGATIPSSTTPRGQ